MPKRLTLLEELAAERTRVTLGATVSRAIERTAEEFANEALRDPAVRAHLRTIVAKQFGRALQDLRATPPRRRRNGRRS